MEYHPQPNIEVNYLITPSEPPEIKRVKYSIQNTFKVLSSDPDRSNCPLNESETDLTGPE